MGGGRGGGGKGPTDARGGRVGIPGRDKDIREPL